MYSRDVEGAVPYHFLYFCSYRIPYLIIIFSVGGYESQNHTTPRNEKNPFLHGTGLNQSLVQFLSTRSAKNWIFSFSVRCS